MSHVVDLLRRPGDGAGDARVPPRAAAEVLEVGAGSVKGRLKKV